jgi:uncharacterized protein DUF6350
MGVMADTLTRPAPQVARGPAHGRPIAIVGMAVALWTALLGVCCLVCVTLAAWITAAHHSDAMRPPVASAVQAWLLAHHAALAISGGTVGIVPLGLTAGLGALLVRGGRQAARLSDAQDLFDCLAVALAVALPYGVIAALLTKLAAWGQVRPDALQALAGAFILASVCAGLGALRETGQGAAAAGRLPADVRHAARAGIAAVAVIVGVGALLVVVGLAGHTNRASALMGSLHGGVSAAVLMALVSIAYVPNLAVWGSAWSVGPGFAVGAKTSVAMGGVHLGALPAVPLLAAVPHSAPPLGMLAIAAPIGAGLLAGWLLKRTGADWTWGFAAGAITGATLGVLAWLSAGPLGPGRMAQLGPSAWQVGLAAAAEVGVLAAATAWLLGWRDHQAASARSDTAAPQE